MEQPNNKQKEASHISLRSILGGEILVHSFLRRQVYLLILIVILTIQCVTAGFFPSVLMKWSRHHI